MWIGRNIKALGIKSSPTKPAGCRGQWGERWSEIKEEAAGRGTFAQAFTPLPSAPTNANRQTKFMNTKTPSKTKRPKPGMNPTTYFNWSTP
jgi:hypothetical protein